MSESVSLPSLGESVTEGTVTRWLKSVGDSVEVDEPLLEVSTDKVDTEIPSPISGVLEKILVEEDETVEVGAELAVIGSGDGAAESEPEPSEAQQESSAESEQTAPSEEAAQAEEASSSEDATAGDADEQAASQSTEETAPSDGEQSSPPQVDEVKSDSGQDTASATESAPSEAPARERASEGGRAHASAGYVTPIVRKLANERGVDLDSVKGTGAGGRIRKQDVLDAASAGSEEETSSPEPRSAERGTTKPLSRLRKVIAERAVTSLQATAQLTSVVEADVTALAEYRERVKDDFADKHGTKLSFMPFFMRAAIEALQEFPELNASIDGDNVVYPGQENISVAVDTPRGLLTPVIHDAARLDIPGLAKDVADLAQRTRDNELGPDELAGGTFTITNTGSRGALFDTPVVFLPQVAILGTGAVTKRPAVITSDDGSDAIAVRSTVYLSLSYDHRLIDGADAARFLSAVKERLEAADFEGLMGN